MKWPEERGLTGASDGSRLIPQLVRAGSMPLPVSSPDAVFDAATA
jgi:hypothetical protein